MFSQYSLSLLLGKVGRQKSSFSTTAHCEAGELLKLQGEDLYKHLKGNQRTVAKTR